MNETRLLEIAITAALQAGEKILQVYNEEFEVEWKSDDSPLTLADKNANDCIYEMLRQTGIPIISEESYLPPFEIRQTWDRLWMVDPLDGTKEFVARNGDFTVNIALIENGVPILGVIYAPVPDLLYYSSSKGAFKKENNKTIPLPLATHLATYCVVGSRSHSNPETIAYLEDLKKTNSQITIVSRGSSIKICLVAEGNANEYPRFGPTMEWDTAAGHAIVLHTGKNIFDLTTGIPLTYNRANLVNPSFVVR